MWIVVDSEKGIICLTNEYEEANKEYEGAKQIWKSKLGDAYAEGDGQVVLAEIKKDFFTVENYIGNHEFNGYKWKEDIY